MSAGFVDASDALERPTRAERELDQLRSAVETRQLIGTVTGIYAHAFGCTPDQAWAFLSRVSQHANIKVRDVARILLAAYLGEVDGDDREQLAALASELPGGRPVIMTRPPSGHDHAMPHPPHAG